MKEGNGRMESTESHRQGLRSGGSGKCVIRRHSELMCGSEISQKTKKKRGKKVCTKGIKGGFSWFFSWFFLVFFFFVRPSTNEFLCLRLSHSVPLSLRLYLLPPLPNPSSPPPPSHTPSSFSSAPPPSPFTDGC